MRPEINIKQTVPISERQTLYVFYHACSSYILYCYTIPCITDDIKLEGEVHRGTKRTGRREKDKERGWREYEEEQAQHTIYTCMKTVKKNKTPPYLSIGHATQPSLAVCLGEKIRQLCFYRHCETCSHASRLEIGTRKRPRSIVWKSHRKWWNSVFLFVPKTSALHDFPPNNWSLRNTSESTPASVGVTDRQLQGG